MESHPLDSIIEDDTRGHQEFPESLRVDAHLIIALEVDPGGHEELNGVVGEDVVLRIELTKVELPDAAPAVGRREITLIVGEGETQLDELEEVDVGFEGLVVELGGGLEIPHGAEDNSGEFGVHGNVGEIIYYLADERDFFFQVVVPHFSDLDQVSALLGSRHVGSSEKEKPARGWKP